MRQSFQESRFKVVNCHRTTETNAEPMSNPKEITIVDIEKHNNNQVAEAAESPANTTPLQSFVPTDDNAAGDGFVYDLYVPDHDHQLPDIDYMDHPFVRYLVFI